MALALVSPHKDVGSELKVVHEQMRVVGKVVSPHKDVGSELKVVGRGVAGNVSCRFTSQRCGV